MEPQLHQSSKPSPARRSSPSAKKKAQKPNVRHMLYVSIFSALATFALSSQGNDLSVVSALCRMVPTLSMQSGVSTTP